MRGLSQLMQQAQKAQENLKKAQQELAQMEVTGQAGGGAVSITMSGRHEARKVRINKEMVGDDFEMLEDLITAAINDAVNRIAEQSESRMANVTGGMQLPPGFKMPF